jgi:hypothetical protein
MVLVYVITGVRQGNRISLGSELPHFLFQGEQRE